jgi:hypothetical protein
VVDDADAAQARVFVATLQDEIRDLSARLAKVGARSGPPGQRHTNRSLALHREATDLRRDISKAQFLIERLERRFPPTTAGTTDLTPRLQITR